MIKLFLFSILQFLTVALFNQLFRNSASLLAQVVILFLLGATFVRLTGTFEKAKQSSLFAAVLVIIYWVFKILYASDINVVFYYLANCFLSMLSLSFFVLPSFLNLQKLKISVVHFALVLIGSLILRDLELLVRFTSFLYEVLFYLFVPWVYPFLITLITVRLSRKMLPHEFWVIGFASYSLAWSVERIIHPYALKACNCYIEPGEEIVIGGMMVYIPFTLMYFLSLYWGTETLKERDE